MTTDLPWEQLHADLRAFIGRRVRNPSDVDDLVQQVLLQIVKGLSSLRDTGRLHAWVYRTARNVVVDHYRASAGRREIASGSGDDLSVEDRTTAPAHGFDEGDDAALRELATCMTPLLRRLPPAYRDAVTLTDLEGISQTEAARRAGLTTSGMKSRVQRGRQQLKAVLNACCRVQLDRSGAIDSYVRVAPDADGCGGCG